MSSFLEYFFEDKNLKKKLPRLEKLIDEGKSLGDLIHLDKSFHSDLYEKGLNYFESNELKSAEKVFALLTLLYPSKKTYWLAFAAVQFSEKLYQEAITSYTLAALLDPSDPLPSIYMALCYKNLGEPKKALSTLNLSKKISEVNLNHTHKALISSFENQLRKEHE